MVFEAQCSEIWIVGLEFGLWSLRLGAEVCRFGVWFCPQSKLFTDRRYNLINYFQYRTCGTLQRGMHLQNWATNSTSQLAPKQLDERNLQSGTIPTPRFCAYKKTNKMQGIREGESPTFLCTSAGFIIFVQNRHVVLEASFHPLSSFFQILRMLNFRRALLWLLCLLWLL